MSQRNHIFSLLTKMYNILVNKGLVRICIYANLLMFLPGLLLAVLIAFLFGPESYNIIDNYISDLGSIRYTPAPLILDIIAMITATFLVPIYFYTAKVIVSDTKDIIFSSNESILKRIFYIYIDIHAFLGVMAMITASIGLFGVGLFSEDRTTELGLHFIFSIIVFAGLAFGALFNGIAILLKKSIFPRFLGLYMMIGPFISTILFIFPPNSATLQLLEWTMLFSAFLWLIPLAFLILKNIRSIKSP